ncbi:MAG: tRNA (adenosine(37)-N6)-dimethylallyltransferase MiaA [Rhodothermia bacterium]
MQSEFRDFHEFLELPPPREGIEAILGPTCVGKTSLSLSRAESIDAEIISADSRQIYREMSIGTAKPTADELARVPHHFINDRSLNEPITAAEFAREAKDRIDRILARGKRVLIVGGSTLYIHALLFGLDDVPATDPAVRRQLSSRLESEGFEPLQVELERVDPVSVRRIDMKNPRRVLRALEVYHTTGRPISDFLKHDLSDDRSGTIDHRPSTIDHPVFVLYRPRDELYARINSRVDAMYEAGLIEEVEAIKEAGLSPALQALQTIGYRETFEYLDGSVSYDKMVGLVKRNTRRYAKRQLTWFSRYRSFDWVSA